MCEYCHHIPHRPGCPNAPDPRPVFVCSGCGRDIVEGDHYTDLLDEQWCDDCVRKAGRYAEYDPW